MSTPSRILITGYTGFVGGYLIEQCHIRYPQAEVFGIAGHPGHELQPAEAQQQISAHVVDITDREAVRQVIAATRPELLIHLAAQSSVAASWKDPLGTLKVNVEGTIHLLDALRSEQVTPCILLIGSGEQYGMIQPQDNPIREECPFRPANPYAVSKATQDLYGYQYFIAHNLPIIRVRAFNHFGPRQPSTFVISSFARQIALIEAGKSEPVLAVGNLQAQRDFLPVEDVVGAYLALAEQGQPGEAYNVGSGHAHSIGAILDLLLACSKKTIQVVRDPARYRPADVPLLVADTTRLRTHTGWKAEVDFERALRNTLDYWRGMVATAQEPHP